MTKKRPRNIIRARGKGMPLAVKSFAALAFNGVKVTAMPERPIPSDLAKPRPVLGVSEDVALQQAWLRRTKPHRWGRSGTLGHRYWGINE